MKKYLAYLLGVTICPILCLVVAALGAVVLGGRDEVSLEGTVATTGGLWFLVGAACDLYARVSQRTDRRQGS